MNVKWIPIFILIMLCAATEISAATITFFIGDVWVKTNGSWHHADKGTQVKSGNVVKTGRGSLAIIAQADGSTLKVYPRTLFTYREDGQKNRAKTILDFISGMIFIKFEKRNADSSFEIQHRTLVASVRGTLFYVAVKRKNLFRKDYWLCVREGSVLLTEKDSDRSVSIDQGKGILVKGSKELTPPKSYDWTGRLNWNMDPAKGAVIDPQALKDDNVVIPNSY